MYTSFGPTNLPKDCFHERTVAGMAVMQPTSFPLFSARTPMCQSLW